MEHYLPVPFILDTANQQSTSNPTSPHPSLRQVHHHWLQFNFFCLKNVITIIFVGFFSYHVCCAYTEIWCIFLCGFGSVLFDLIEFSCLYSDQNTQVYLFNRWMRNGKEIAPFCSRCVTIRRWFKLVSKTNLWYTDCGTQTHCVLSFFLNWQTS